MPASEFLVAFTITMTRIVVLLSVWHDGVASTDGDRLPCLSDMATNEGKGDRHARDVFPPPGGRPWTSGEGTVRWTPVLHPGSWRSPRGFRDGRQRNESPPDTLSRFMVNLFLATVLLAAAFLGPPPSFPGRADPSDRIGVAAPPLALEN